MRILCITPRIKGEGGVARVLSIKANYFSNVLGYEVHILTQNEGNFPLFFDFSDKIVLHDMVLEGNKMQYLIQYRKALKAHINKIKPDIIMVSDNGLKAYFIPWLLQTNIPIIFESHGSRFVQENNPNGTLFENIKLKISFALKNWGAQSFDKFIVLSEESKKEWNLKNIQIISNPNWFSAKRISDFKNQKVISVSRHSYEKGLDRLLLVWQKVIKKHPNWILDVYGKSDNNKTYHRLAKELKIANSINFFEPIKNIQNKYQEASMFLMTSRFEGFPMVLIEALASGLPCVAFDCPVGPRALISNNENGFLIQDDQIDEFVLKVNLLIENNDLAKTMGQKGMSSVKTYNTENIMKQWVDLFESLKNK